MLEDRESYQNADGTHRGDVVYSRRETHELELQAQNGATLDPGATMTIDGVLCNVIDKKIARTRGPTIVTINAVAQAEQLA
jgi:hypothetical protein